jgi:hypothetical protein
MPTVAITGIGHRAATTLRTATLLQVSATFDRSFYLRTGGDFVCIGGPAIGNGPLNALVNRSACIANRCPGDIVRSNGQHLTFPDGLMLEWTDAPTWTMPPWPSAATGQADNRRALTPPLLASMLARSPKDGLFQLAVDRLFDRQMAVTSPLLRRAAAAIDALIIGLAAGAAGPNEDLRSAAAGLIGLGPGLTPSGDDVLAGALLGLQASNQQALAARLGPLVAAASVDGTSPLSAAFLGCAIDGQTSAVLRHALAAVLTATDLPSALDSLDSIGHTSGWDHLAGFLLALMAAKPATAQPRPVS